MIILLRQNGLILIVSLIFLILLTLLTLTAIETSTLEVKMRTNDQSRNIAFQAAESALREAEHFIISSDTVFNPVLITSGPFQGSDCIAGLCPYTSSPLCLAIDFNWLTKGRVVNAILQNSVQAPRYVIELLSHAPSSDGKSTDFIFRITARAWGMDINTVVQLQSYFSLQALNKKRIAWHEIVN